MLGDYENRMISPGETHGQKLLGIKAIADYMDRSEATIRNYIKTRNLPAWKVGGLIESNTAKLDSWMGKR